MPFPIGLWPSLVSNCCNEGQKLCKSLEAKNSGLVSASIPAIQIN